VRRFGRFLIVFGIGTLLTLNGGAALVRAAAQGQQPVPTSTRPAPPPLASPTSLPVTATAQPPPPVPPPSPEPTLAPVEPTPAALPEAGGEMGGLVFWLAGLLGGGAALALGARLRRRSPGG
jgi:hypothetical protein